MLLFDTIGWTESESALFRRLGRERRIDGKQLRLNLSGPSVRDGDKLWEYAVLVTDVDYPLESIGQLYRGATAPMRRNPSMS